LADGWTGHRGKQPSSRRAVASGRPWRGSFTASEGRDELLASAQVEAGGRLVEDEEVRFRHERPGDEDPLPLPGGEGPEGALGEVPDTEALEERAGPNLVGVAPGDPPRSERRRARRHDELERGETTVEERLEGGARVPDPAPELADVDRAEAPAEDLDGADRRGEPATGDGEQGRLAGAIRAEDDPSLPRPDRPVEGSEDRATGPADGDAPQLDDGRRARGSPGGDGLGVGVPGGVGHDGNRTVGRRSGLAEKRRRPREEGGGVVLVVRGGPTFRRSIRPVCDAAAQNAGERGGNRIAGCRSGPLHRLRRGHRLGCEEGASKWWAILDSNQ
jgi:hypothetical protein